MLDIAASSPGMQPALAKQKQRFAGARTRLDLIDGLSNLRVPVAAS